MFLTGPNVKYRVILVGICANMASFVFGTCIGWLSPVMPKLRDHSPDSPLSTGLTTSQEGWIASLFTIGALVSSLISGIVGAKVGKKLTLLVGVTLIEFSYILLLVASELWMFYAARLLQGLGGGLVIATLPMYIGEIATDGIRGALGSTITLFMVGGILYSYCIGPFVNYAIMQWCCIALPIFFVGTFIFMPETPYYLAKKERKMDLLKSLEFLRGGSGKAIEDEMNQIITSVAEDSTEKRSMMEIFHDRGNVKALIICSGLLIFQQLSGTSAVTFNGQTIFTSANLTLDPAVATILMALTQLFANFLTPFFIERTGRKPILLVSASGMSLSLFALGAFFYIQKFGDVSSLKWIPVPALICFNIFYAFGFGPVPWALMSELFSSNAKPMAATIACTTSKLTTFVVTRWYPELNALGVYYAFFIFGALMAISIFFILFYVIETKGLPFERIQEKLRSKK